jgi:transcriptional regulator with XRE-family HTH domain
VSAAVQRVTVHRRVARFDRRRRLLTAGRRALVTLLQRYRREEVARAAGVRPAMIGHLATGHRLPSLRLAFAMKHAWGIEPESWLLSDDE